MPTSLDLTQHLAGLHAAMVAFGRHAEDAGLDVAVPTCPEWTVRRLIGHQGAVHRWAAGCLRGEDVDWAPVEKAGRSSADPVEWLRDGAIDLVETLVGAPDDVEAPTFLHDAPPPRRFWARRQCHETTMHAVDALSAALGRLPRPDEVDLSPELALDGVDELVLGFVPRSRSRLHSPTPVRLTLVASDLDVSFTVDVSADAPPVSARHERRLDGDLVAAAPAVHLYLALWHRTELDSPVWPLWHDSAVH